MRRKIKSKLLRATKTKMLNHHFQKKKLLTKLKKKRLLNLKSMLLKLSNKLLDLKKTSMKNKSFKKLQIMSQKSKRKHRAKIQLKLTKVKLNKITVIKLMNWILHLRLRNKLRKKPKLNLTKKQRKKKKNRWYLKRKKQNLWRITNRLKTRKKW